MSMNFQSVTSKEVLFRDINSEKESKLQNVPFGGCSTRRRP